MPEGGLAWVCGVCCTSQSLCAERRGEVDDVAIFDGYNAGSEEAEYVVCRVLCVSWLRRKRWCSVSDQGDRLH